MSLDDAISNARQQLNIETQLAYLGNGSGDPRDRKQVGNYFVRIVQADGRLSAAISMPAHPNAKFPVNDNFAVRLGYDEDGEQVILGAYRPGVQSAGINPLTLNPLDTVVNSIITQAKFSTFYFERHGDTTNKPLTVSIFPAFIVIGTTTTYFAGGEIDIASFVPSTGLQCFVVVLWKTDNTLEGFSSTPINTADPLSDADIQEAINQRSTGSLPICAWRLVGDQAALSSDETQRVDLRQMINVVEESSGGSGITQLTGDVTAGPGSGSQVATITQPLTLTSPVINTGVSGTAIDNDATLAANSSTLLPTQAAVKGYVDQTVLGLNAKADVRLATAAALATNTYNNGASGVGATLTGVATGVLTVDGVTVALNDRILVKDEVAGANNGIYKCTVAGAIGVAYVLTRTTDGDTDAELRGGWMFSLEGTANAGQGWLNTNISAITFGTTAITFGEFSAGVIAAGTGLTKTGNTIALDTPVALANGGTHADLSATGGTNQFLKQSSAGANVSVGGIVSADLTTALSTPPAIGGTTPGTGAFTDLSTTTFEDFAEASTPSTPTSDHLREWALDDQGFTEFQRIDSGAVIVRAGRDVWIICRNTTGGSITKGTWFAVNGQSNGYPSVIAAESDNVSTNSQLRLAHGVAMDAAANNGYFRLMIYGVLNNFDTSGFSVGAQLWLSATAGTATSTLPSAGAGWAQYLGRVLTSNASTGSIQVSIQTPYLAQIFNTAVAVGQSSGAAQIDFYMTGGKVSLVSPSSVTSNKTVTIQDATDTLVGRDTTDTLTNKKFDDGVVINETGGNNDTRIEGDTDQNLVFVDASADAIGIGTAGPTGGAILDVVSTAKGSRPAPVMTAAQVAAISSPAQGLTAYESDTEHFDLYDGQRFRLAGVAGWVPYAHPVSQFLNADFATALTLPANGGSVAVPMMVTGHMLLQSVTIHQVSTGTARTWAWDLYEQFLNNGNSGENTVTRIAASNGSQNFTPTVASNQTLDVTSAPVYIAPGVYWLVIQNRHATNTLTVGVRAALGTLVPNTYQTKTTTNPNGSTLDLVAATWTKATDWIGVMMNGRVLGQTAAY